MKTKITVGNMPENEGDVMLYSVKAEYIQNKDCCDGESDSLQTLTIETQNGGVGAEDTFMILSTERWAIDSEDDILKAIRDFKNRIS